MADDADREMRSNSTPVACGDTYVDARALMLPLLIALLPLTALATMFFILPVLAPAIMTTAGLRAENFGWLGGAVGLGSVLFFLTNHAITPVFGPLGTLRLGMVLAIAGGVLFFAHSWVLMVVGSLLVGFGYGTTTPTGSQILADFTPRSAWGTLFSIRQAGVPAGGIVAAAIASATLSLYGWTTSMGVTLMLLAMVAGALVVVPRRFNASRPLELFSAQRLFDINNIVRPYRIVRSVRGLPTLVAAGCGLAMSHGAVTQFFVLYLHSLGAALTDAAALFALVQTCAMAGRIVFGGVADKMGSSRIVLLILAPLSAAASGLLAFYSVDWSFTGQVVAAIIIGLTVGTWNGLYLAEIARLVTPAMVASATASSAVFTFVTYMITPPLVGTLASNFGWRSGFLAVAMAPIGAGLLLAWHQATAGNSAIPVTLLGSVEPSHARSPVGQGRRSVAVLNAPGITAALCVAIVAVLGSQQYARLGSATQREGLRFDADAISRDRGGGQIPADARPDAWRATVNFSTRAPR